MPVPEKRLAKCKQRHEIIPLEIEFVPLKNPGVTNRKRQHQIVQCLVYARLLNISLFLLFYQSVHQYNLASSLIDSPGPPQYQNTATAVKVPSTQCELSLSFLLKPILDRQFTDLLFKTLLKKTKSYQFSLSFNFIPSSETCHFFLYHIGTTSLRHPYWTYSSLILTVALGHGGFISVLCTRADICYLIHSSHLL